VELSAAAVPEYLASVGLLEAPANLVARESAGRNRNFVVEEPGEGQRWFVKQFRAGDAGLAAFAREREFAARPDAPAVTPALADEAARVLVYPGAGRPLSELLQGDAALPAGVPERLAGALENLRAQASGPGQLPPIVGCLANPTGIAEPSLAERRLLTSLLEADEPAALAAACAEAWADGPRSATHGDLKLEHVLVDERGEIRLVDWESVGAGPAEWDAAGLIQSALAQVVLGIADWSNRHAAIVRSVAGDARWRAADLAPFVALRLWQTAIEWAGGRALLPRRLGDLCQCGIALARDPEQLRRIVLASEAA
jgi:Phosphotransferase enzyme family